MVYTRSKENALANDNETLKNNFMHALNDKFILRSQLKALKNVRDDLYYKILELEQPWYYKKAKSSPSKYHHTRKQTKTPAPEKEGTSVPKSTPTKGPSKVAPPKLPEDQTKESLMDLENQKGVRVKRSEEVQSEMLKGKVGPKADLIDEVEEKRKRDAAYELMMEQQFGGPDAGAEAKMAEPKLKGPEDMKQPSPYAKPMGGPYYSRYSTDSSSMQKESGAIMHEHLGADEEPYITLEEPFMVHGKPVIPHAAAHVPFVTRKEPIIREYEEEGTAEEMHQLAEEFYRLRSILDYRTNVTAVVVVALFMIGVFKEFVSEIADSVWAGTELLEAYGVVNKPSKDLADMYSDLFYCQCHEDNNYDEFDGFTDCGGETEVFPP